MSALIPHTLLTDFDIHLFRTGTHYSLYEKLGSHVLEKDGIWGTLFAVWAPTARKVSVTGDFNGWKGDGYELFARPDGSGIWEGFLPDVGHGKLYKYEIISYEGRKLVKGDPFARFWEIPPNTSTIIWDQRYDWQDGQWIEKRKATTATEQPMSVYEVHLGSWRKKAGGAESLTYREMADELVAYVTEMGFTHIEMMPVMEHPYYPSWGYQVTGFFAPTSRFGLPEDFKYLVDKCHEAGIGVLLDWVPSHFPTDAHGLGDFDGTHLYEHADPRQGFHPDWKSYIFNYGRNEVKSFLISNALFWVREYHADGIRVDAVASMLYRDYSREEGQWIPNKYGGNENLEAIAFLKELNGYLRKEHPDVQLIAEESTAFAGVSQSVENGGLGFHQKWMMGWMHDTLKYFGMDPIHRKFHHNQITFSLIYAFSEHFMLPLSHDEVVHGKGSLFGRMPGDSAARTAQLKLLFGYMFTHPGTKLLFMGGEFGQFEEWSHTRGLDWKLLEEKNHQSIQATVKKLNHLYASEPALYRKQFSPDGFEWIDHTDYQNSVLIYLRKGDDTDKPLVVMCHFTPVARPEYTFGVPFGGTWELVFSTDDTDLGGATHLPQGFKAKKEEKHNQPNSITVAVPPFSVQVFRPKRLPAKKKVEKPKK